MSKDAQKITLFRHAGDSTVHAPGTTLFKEGDDGHEMYAIKRGSVSVRVNGKDVDTLGPDEVFGEMALLDHHTRSATVVTTEETELVRIDEKQFLNLVRSHPHFALQLMRVLTERVRSTYALNR